jgi:hypothetical protein
MDWRHGLEKVNRVKLLPRTKRVWRTRHKSQIRAVLGVVLTARIYARLGARCLVKRVVRRVRFTLPMRREPDVQGTCSERNPRQC